MFEGSLVESVGLRASSAARWSALGSITLQCMLAALLLAIPLLRPGSVPIIADAPHLIAPPLPRPPAPPVQIGIAATSSTALSAPAPAPAAASGPRIFLTHPGVPTDAPAPPIGIGLHMEPGGPGPFEALSGMGDTGPGSP